MRDLFLLIILICSYSANCQYGSIQGVVKDGTRAVPYARIKLKNTAYGTVADSSGIFTLKEIPYGTYEIYASALGFIPAALSITVDSIKNDVLIVIKQQSIELNSVVVTGSMREVTLSKSPVKIEVLTPQFFKINPVNSVIEALQTVNGVQEQVNCGVCGTNDIHINGMEGPYTLVLIDGMPIVSGLSSTYGFNGIPTSIIQRVEIVKGPSSTLYGTEAVGGVINIITKSPQNMAPADAEIYVNSHQEYKVNFAVSPKINNHVSTALSLDYYYNQFRMDFNQDNFTDIPLNNRISVFNKWTISDKKSNPVLSLAGRYYYEDRFGGVMNWSTVDKGSDSIYGEFINTRRVELIGSYKPTFAKNFRFDFSANSHQQNSWYGIVNYAANQKVFFSNLIWDKKLNRRNQLLIGFTNKFIDYEDNTLSATDQKKYVPGVFSQHEFNITEQLIVLTGVRLDYHSEHGIIFSPRLSLKKQFGDFSAFRFNYGTGFREVYLATEDHAFVTGSRQVVILEKLNPERSHNITLNFNHTHNFLGYGNFDVDIFYTYFMNKIVANYEQNPQLIVYENLTGYGTTRGISAALFHQFNKVPFQLRLGATWMQVFELINDVSGKIKVPQLFVPAFSATFALGYEWKKWKLSFNYTGKIMGHQNLPTFLPPFERPEISPWYSLQNFQITKKFKFPLEIFGGIKNVLNYTQPSPLINPQNPYDPSFDTSYAYAPLQPRRYYFGIRYTFMR